jgi:hypothetical protein
MLLSNGVTEMHRVLIPDTREAIRAYDYFISVFVYGYASV